MDHILAIMLVSFGLAGQTLHPPTGQNPRPTESGLFAVAHVDPFQQLFVVPEPARDVSPLQEAQKPPKPTHTGFQALIRSTGSDFKAFPRRKSTWVILAIGGAAAALALPVDDEVTENLYGSSARKYFAPGRILGAFYVQTSAAIGTYVLGRYVIKPGGQKSNKLTHIGFDLLRAQALSQAFTLAMKYSIQRDRPNGECCSFPSGHASATFASAAVLERHFGYRSAWPTFLIGGYVAASRMFDNRHFLSDVLFGSALGIASGWTVVGRHGRDEFAWLPVPTHRGVAFIGTWSPGSSHAHTGEPGGHAHEP